MLSLLGQQPFPRMLFTVLLQAFLAPLHNLYPFKDGSLSILQLKARLLFEEHPEPAVVIQHFPKW